MFEGLGIHWASSIPAFLALACIPFPFLFYKYGPAIRKRCKYAAQAQAFLKRLREEAQQGSDDTSIEDSGSADNKDEEDPPLNFQSGQRKEQDREAQLEAEAMDYSYGDEEHQPEYAAIKARTERRPSKEMVAKKSSGSLNQARSRPYDGNPYDIDRVNTNESFGKRPSNSRASSHRRYR